MKIDPEIASMLSRALRNLSEVEAAMLLSRLPDTIRALDGELAARAPAFDLAPAPAAWTCPKCGCTDAAKLSHWYLEPYCRGVLPGGWNVDDSTGCMEGSVSARSFLTCNACGVETTIPRSIDAGIDYILPPKGGR
jgi:hypothetical protein